MLSSENRCPIFQTLENMKDFIPSDINDFPAAWRCFMTPEEVQSVVASFNDPSLTDVNFEE